MAAVDARTPVGLSTSCSYPESTTAAFEIASRLGYDGVEVLVWTDPVSQDAAALRRLVDHFGVPVLSVHAPTLLLTQGTWGRDPWGKLEKSAELAAELGAGTVVVHPPFRWQRDYAAGFVAGIGELEARTGVTMAVENMFPWRARGRELVMYAPGWDPTDLGYRHLTLDYSHAATSGRTAWSSPGPSATGSRTCTCATGRGRPRTSTWCRGTGRNPSPRRCRSWRATVSGGRWWPR